jgi:MFS family permease
MLGAALGVLFTYFIIRNFNGNIDYNRIFIISIIPAALGLFMFIFVKEKKVIREVKKREPFWKNINKIDSQLKFYLVIVFIFSLGQSSTSFFVLKGMSIGFDNANIILLFFIYHVVASILSMPFGKLSDRIGRKNLLVPGYIAFSVCYVVFAFASNSFTLVLAFILFGIYTAMIIGVERAFVAEISPPELKGTMLGLHSTVSGIGLLPASIITGVLWNIYGSIIPFLLGAFLSLISALLLVIFMKSRKETK